MNIYTSKSFNKSFSKLESKIQKRVINSVEKLPSGDIKQIKGVNTVPSTFRLRIGKYRILLRMDDKTIYLDKIDTRGDIYKN